MKDILGAGKKPVTEWALSDIGIEKPINTVEKLSTLAPKQKERGKVIFEGEGKVSEFYESIRSALR
jgi:electron transfer flavoprotein beta subunit